MFMPKKFFAEKKMDRSAWGKLTANWGGGAHELSLYDPAL